MILTSTLLLTSLFHHRAHKKKVDPRDLQAQTYIAAQIRQLADDLDNYPALYDKYVAPLITDLDKLAGEKVADPSFRNDFDQMQADAWSLGMAEKLMDEKRFEEVL